MNLGLVFGRVRIGSLKEVASSLGTLLHVIRRDHGGMRDLSNEDHVGLEEAVNHVTLSNKLWIVRDGGVHTVA